MDVAKIWWLVCASGCFVSQSYWVGLPALSTTEQHPGPVRGTLETEEREAEKEMIKTSFIMMFGVIQEGVS